MENKYNFDNICPDFNDYKQYLEETGSEEFTKLFNEHIQKCSLCKDAIEGYKTANLYHVETKLIEAKNLFSKKTHKHYSNFRLLAYAATILIIIGVFSIAITTNNTAPNYEQASLFDHSLLIQENSEGHKTLSKKSNEQYMYISSCNTIAYNDQIIDIDKIDKIKGLSDASLLRVEVAVENNECAFDLIENIKKSYNIPVLTIKERKQL